MTNNQTSIKFEIFVAYPLLIVIGFYIIASALVPFLNVNFRIFTTIFTLSGAIPAITLFLKEKFTKNKQNAYRA